MNTFTPCFPPVILEKCLDLAKNLADKKTGNATLEINLGASRFSFSMDHSSPIQTGSSRQDILKKKRKKSPSDRRRDSLRRENHLERKRNPSPPGVSSSNPVSTSSMEISDSPQVPVIIEEPVTNTSDTVEVEPVPVINATRNESEIKDDDDDDDDDDDNASNSMISINEEPTQILDLPPAISPINSPLKCNKNHEEMKEEIHFLFCAKDQATAKRLAKPYQRHHESKYIGPHPKNKHHFYFSSYVSPANLSGFKEACAWNDHFLFARVVSEKKNYQPTEPPHCQACRIHHRKN